MARAPTSSSPTPTWRRPPPPRPSGVFDNAGQDCCARSRILVAAQRLRPVHGAASSRGQGVAVGDPARTSTEMGPLISAAHRERVAAYVPDGAPVAFRGSAPDGPGFWFPPTVLAPVAPMTGPAPRRSSARWSRWRRSRTRRTRSRSPTTRPTGCPAPSGPGTWAGRSGWRGRVETGNLSVNSHSSVRYWTPFGGFKQSGLGRELGPDALDAFTETKNVFIATED